MQLLSVIVPVYNKSEYLADCLDSILVQEMKDFVVILVDDGSTDGSEIICQKYASKYDNIVYLQQENQGPIRARLKGLCNSHSKYVTFVDADDWISPDTYQNIRDYMVKGIDCICYSMIRYYNENKQYRVPQAIPEGIYENKALAQNVYPQMIWSEKKETWMIDPSLCNKIIKYEYMIEEYKKAKDLGIHYGEDIAIIYPVLSRIGSLAITNKGTYYHRQFLEQGLKKYMNDDEYYEKLFKMYSYIKKRIRHKNEFIRQLDFLYVNSIILGLRKYKRSDNEKVGYLFPFNIIDKDSKIVLFGAGKVGKAYREQIERLKYCSIVLWVDSDYERYKNPDIKDPKQIDKIGNYDYIVIAVKNKSNMIEIKKLLLGKGIIQEKIVWQVD